MPTIKKRPAAADEKKPRGRGSFAVYLLTIKTHPAASDKKGPVVAGVSQYARSYPRGSGDALQHAHGGGRRAPWLREPRGRFARAVLQGRPVVAGALRHVTYVRGSCDGF